MAKTTKTKVAAAPRPSGDGSGSRSKTTAGRMRASRSVSDLAASIRKRLAALDRGAARRDMLAELERYERAIARWASVAPTAAQNTAMHEQLLALEERLRSGAPTKPPPAQPAPAPVKA